MFVVCAFRINKWFEFESRKCRKRRSKITQDEFTEGYLPRRSWAFLGSVSTWRALNIRFVILGQSFLNVVWSRPGKSFLIVNPWTKRYHLVYKYYFYLARVKIRVEPVRGLQKMTSQPLGEGILWLSISNRRAWQRGCGNKFSKICVTLITDDS